MIKKIAISFSLFAILFLNLINICDIKSNEYDIAAKSGILVEVSTGEVLYEKNPDEKYAPASVTKIMTMLLAMEAIDNNTISLKDNITISENAKKMGGSTMLLESGEIRTVEDILKGIAIASGNDSAVAMAEFIAGTTEEFVNKMNEKAVSLGMNNTYFKNPTGLPEEGHYSSARDISIMSLELLKHEDILNYTSIYMDTISDGRKSPIDLVNHNKLVRFFEGCDGLKTGFTDDAKYCISSTAKRDGVRVLAVVMGADDYKTRNQIAANLMNSGFSKFESKVLIEKNGDVEKIALNKKGDKFFILKAENEVSVVTKKGENIDITKKITITSKEKYYKAGEIIGYVQILKGDKVLETVNIYSDRDVKLNSFLDNFKENLENIMYKGI